MTPFNTVVLLSSCVNFVGFFQGTGWSPRLQMKDLRRTRKIRRSRACPGSEEQLINTKTRFVCTICGKGMTSRPRLNGHMATNHNAPKEYKCNVCGDEFSYKHRLKAHLVRHQMEMMSMSGEPNWHFDAL